MNALALTKQPEGLRVPPYGREVMAAMASGSHPNVRLYACRPDPWTPARLHRDTFGAGAVLVLPVGTDPEAFRWPPVRNLIANVAGLPGATLHALAKALVRDGLILGYLLDAEHPERNVRIVAKRRSP